MEAYRGVRITIQGIASPFWGEFLNGAFTAIELMTPLLPFIFKMRIYFQGIECGTNVPKLKVDAIKIENIMPMLNWHR